MNNSGTTGSISRNLALAGVALISFASLLLELALTRLFSVVLYYHFAFLAISLAMLGLGAGGVFSFLQRDWLSRWTLRPLLGRLSLLSAVSVWLAMWIAFNTRVFLVLSLDSLLHLSLLYLAAAVPFFFTGLQLSLLFARESKTISNLYGADLIGGALACLVVVPLLNTLGGPNAILLSSLVMLAAAALWSEAGALRKGALAVAAALALFIGVNRSQALLDVVYAKGMLARTEASEFVHWNAISRIQVDNWDGDKWVKIDADAATLIARTDPRDQQSRQSLGIANLLRPQGDFAIIGPGGGTDVLAALTAGSRKVTGIEINPIIANTLMRGRYAEYSHRLYSRPEVQIHVAEGRSWIRGSSDKFDVIQMTLVDTWASTSAGAFALSENNLYTVEAFGEYFSHLKPAGFIAVTRWEFAQPREALRVVSQAIEALRRMGVEDVRRHFIVLADARLNEKGQRVTVLARATPFTPQEENIVLRHVQETPGVYPLYLPHLYGPAAGQDLCGGASAANPETGCIDAGLAQLPKTRFEPEQTVAPFYRLITLSGAASGGRGESPRAAFISSYPFEISPVTDDAPFFFFTFKAGQTLRALLAGNSYGSVDWKNNVGLAVLGMTLILSIAAVLGFLIGPLALRADTRRQPLTPLLYFVAIGLGYILTEIAVIQRFVLFLGHPTYALTVVVFVLLLTSGIGSLASRRWLRRAQHVRPVLGAVAGLVVLYVFRLHGLLSAWVGGTFAEKLLVSAALLAPLGFLMGMPFPTGLRVMAERREASAAHAIEWAWALNAAASVLGSVLAISISLQFGFAVTLGCAAAAYGLAALFTLQWNRTEAAPAAGTEQEKDEELVHA